MIRKGRPSKNQIYIIIASEIFKEPTGGEENRTHSPEHTVVCRIHTNDGGIGTTLEEGTRKESKKSRERNCAVGSSDSSVLVVRV